MTGLTGARAASGRVRPGGLHGEPPGGQREHERAATAARVDPGTLVGVLLAGEVGPAAGRVLVGDGLGVLVPLHDREAVAPAAGTGADEMRPAGGTHVGDVGHVGERDGAVVGGHRAAAEGGVAVVVVPGAEL